MSSVLSYRITRILDNMKAIVNYIRAHTHNILNRDYVHGGRVSEWLHYNNNIILVDRKIRVKTPSRRTFYNFVRLSDFRKPLRSHTIYRLPDAAVPRLLK